MTREHLINDNNMNVGLAEAPIVGQQQMRPMIKIIARSFVVLDFIFIAYFNIYLLSDFLPPGGVLYMLILHTWGLIICTTLYLSACITPPSSHANMKWIEAFSKTEPCPRCEGRSRFPSKPFRAHHCSKCASCVIRMDHHCAFIQNCVGIRNHKTFLHLTTYGGVSAAIAAMELITFHYFNLGWTNPKVEGHKTFTLGYFIKFIHMTLNPISLSSIALALGATSLYGALQGETALEKMIKKKKICGFNSFANFLRFTGGFWRGVSPFNYQEAHAGFFFYRPGKDSERSLNPPRLLTSRFNDPNEYLDRLLEEKETGKVDYLIPIPTC